MCRRGLRCSRSQGPYEPFPVVLELADLRLDPPRNVVDRHEERHLPVPQGVHHLAITAADLEDRLPVGHELHLGQMLGEAGLLRQELPRPADPLQRHAAVQQRLHDPERDEVTERIEPRHPGAATGPLDRRLDESDLVPVAELARRATGELASLMSGETLHPDARPFDVHLPSRTIRRDRHGLSWETRPPATTRTQGKECTFYTHP